MTSHEARLAARTRHSFALRFSFGAILFTAAPAVAIDPNPPQARGIPTEGTTLKMGSDYVTPRNRNVTIQIPVGPRLPQKGNLTLPLTAAYNLNFWQEAKDKHVSTAVTTLMDYAFITAGGDLGPGWILRPFGRISTQKDFPEDIAYEDPTGAKVPIERQNRRTFSPPTLPPDGWTRLGLTDARQAFRLNPNGYWEMLTPDGTLTTFGREVRTQWNKPLTALEEQFGIRGISQHSPISGWYPTAVRDVFNNVITICYFNEVNGAAHLMKQIVDSEGRQITFTIRNRPGSQMYVYDTVTYPAFGGQDVTLRFEYDTKDVFRPWTTGGCQTTGPVRSFSQSIGVGSIACNPIGHPASDCGVVSTACNPNPPAPIACGAPYPTLTLSAIRIPVQGSEEYRYAFATNSSGEVETWTRPTGASVTYAMNDVAYRYTSATCGFNAHDDSWCDSVSATTWTRGVQQRTLTSGTQVSSWTYATSVEGLGCWTGSPTLAIVTDPAGNDTEYMYWGSQRLEESRVASERIGGNSCGPNYPEANCDCYQGVNGPSGCIPLEEAYLSSPADGLLCRTIHYDGAHGKNVRLRVEDSQWEMSGNDNPTEPAAWPRVKAKKVSYPGDAGVFHLIRYDGYDGYGHYSTETHSGNMGGDARKTETVWTPDRARWLLDKYTSRTVFDTDLVTIRARSLYDFDAATGRMRSETARCYSTGNYTDCDSSGNKTPVTRAVEWDSAGFPRQDSWTGGTGFNYYTSSQYDHGVLQRNWYTDGANPPRSIGWDAVNRTIDPRSSLPSSERDTAGVSTSYSYDFLGRLRGSSRDGETPFVIEYPTPTKVVAHQGSPGTPSHVEYTEQLDPVGQIAETTSLTAEGQVAHRLFAYDAFGRQRSVSEWAAASNSTPAQTVTSYDPLGRPKQVISPDGSIDYTYTGVRHVKRTVHGVGSPPQDSTYHYDYDAFGRLVRVVDPYGNPTTYGYDVLDRLTTVEQSGASQTRTRVFEYDSLGRLRASSEPESGDQTYKSYDSRGNVVKRRDANGIDHAFAYDLAGRPLKKWVNSWLVEAWTYDADDNWPKWCGTDGLSAGRLVKAVLYNSESDPAERVTEHFCYDDMAHGKGLITRAGAVFGEGRSFEAAFAYDTEGRIASVDYPRLSGSPSRRSLGQTYAHGNLVAIGDGTGYVTGATTNYAGGLKSLTYGSGAVGTFTPDARNRIAGIDYRFPNQQPFWAQGSFTYDGAGNLFSHRWLAPAAAANATNATNTYTYDLLSTLATASFADQQGSNHSGAWAADPFANLTTYVQDGVSLLPSGLTYPNNRMSAFLYDGNGNQLSDGSHTLAFNNNDLLRSASIGPSAAEVYRYDTGRQRVARRVGDVTRYFLRAPGSGKVLSEFEARTNCPEPTWIKDYIYFGGNMVAMVDHPIPPLPAWVGAAPGFEQAQVSWEAAPGPFNVHRAKGARDSAMDLVATGVSCNPSSAPPYGCTFVDTGLDSASTYYYWVATLTDCYEAGMLGPVSVVPDYSGGGFGPTVVLTNDGDEYCDALAAAAPPSVPPAINLSCTTLGSPPANSVWTWYYYWDHLGTPRAASYGGSILSRWDYWPYGVALVVAPDILPANTHKFTGHERDRKTKLDYMMARYYSAGFGRFLSTDPVNSADPTQPLTWNEYSYARGNPQSLIDPTGAAADSPSKGDSLWHGDAFDDLIGDLRAAQGASAVAGATLINDAAVRADYVSVTSQLDPANRTARTAAKIAARGGSSPVGQGLAEYLGPLADEAGRLGTASKTNAAVNEAMVVAGKAGRGLIVVGAAVSMANVASAAEGQRVHAALREGGAWTGSLAFGAAGMKGGAVIGSFFSPGLGTAIGGGIGGLGGGIAGAFLGERAVDEVYAGTGH